MLRLHAHNPLFIATASVTIAVAGFAFMAPRLTQTSAPAVAMSQPEFVHVGIQRPLMMSRGVAPKLSVRVPAASMSASAAVSAPMIAETGSLELLVSNVDAVADHLNVLAYNANGEVFSLETHSAGDGHASQSADATIRVPATAFEGTIQRLVALGTVRSRSVKAEDLTGDITDSSARLRNLQRTERDILKIMDRSGDVSQIMDVENQLSTVREQIETLQADVASMRGRVAYSTIDIHLESEARNMPIEPSALTQVKDTIAAATHSLLQTTVSLIGLCIWLVVFIPYALLAALAALALRLALRKYAVRR